MSLAGGGSSHLPYLLYPATPLSTSLALHCLERSHPFYKFSLFLRFHSRLCRYLWVSCMESAKEQQAASELFVSDQLYPWVVLPYIHAVSLLYRCDLVITPPPRYLLHSALHKMRPQLCKPKIAYCIFAQHLAWTMWARASAGDWKASNSWQSWLKCIPWKYFSAENGFFH